MLRGLVPIATDALAGAYYPWAGQNWGFMAGVPFKNISLTDVFSQLFPWRSLAVDLIKHGVAPLWNPYSFSGYPLLANWQSAPFYPLNFLMVLFGNARGYGFMVFAQPILAASFMYLFLRQIKLSKAASSLGAIVSAYSGFVMVYLEYATIGQILIWLPLILFFIEKYFVNKRSRFLAFSALCLFPVLTGGFFQPAFYVVLIAFAYYFFRCLALPKEENKPKLLVFGAIVFLIGAATAAVQLIPTMELLNYSIRNLDGNITAYNYGLLPTLNFITFLAPDFFGNPATANYWGTIQYQEVTGYFSIIAFALAYLGLLSRKRNWRLNFFSFLFVISIILAFDNPVGRAIYQFRIPLLSTGYASRWLIVTAFSGAFLASFYVERLNRKKLFSILALILATLIFVYGLIWKQIIPIEPPFDHIALRNLILPMALVSASIGISVLIKNRNFAKWLLLILVAFDLGRFTVKFTPFSEPQYTERSIPVFDYIKSQNGIDRVISDIGAILPANTWMYAKLYSPSGYDPLLVKDYAIFFRGLNTGQKEASESFEGFDRAPYTRYLNVVNTNSSLLDLVGTKYLLGVKYDPYGKIRPWGEINKAAINQNKYKPVFESGESIVFQNQTAMPRVDLFYQAESEMNNVRAVEKLVEGFDFRNVLLLNEEAPSQYAPGENDSVQITKYSENIISFQTKTENGAYLFLSDTYYPGWKAYVNGKAGKILRADSVFRAVELPPGAATVEMIYSPDSFKAGAVISAIALTILFVLSIKRGDKKTEASIS